MTTFYFTSTGNSLMVAKKIGGKLVSIPKVLRSGELNFKDDAIGLVFPVYGLCVPPIILEFLEKANFETEYLFAVLTYGTIACAACDELKTAISKKNQTYSYINELHMKENYLPRYDMQKEKKPAHQEEKLAEICRDINNRKNYIIKKIWLEKYMTSCHRKKYCFDRGVGFSKDFAVEEKCVGCGTCAKVCPANNIKIVDGKPIFAEDCLSCFACTHNCPQNAIRLKGEKSEQRYRNPEITLEEIIEANN